MIGYRFGCVLMREKNKISQRTIFCVLLQSLQLYVQLIQTKKYAPKQNTNLHVLHFREVQDHIHFQTLTVSPSEDKFKLFLTMCTFRLDRQTI